MNIDKTEGLRNNTEYQETLQSLQPGDLMTADVWIRVCWREGWNVVQATIVNGYVMTLFLESRH